MSDSSDAARCTVAVSLADPAQQDADDLARAWLVLDAEERGRADRFQRGRDRQTYVVAHSLLRCVLSRHTGIGASDLRFSRTRHGRPELIDAGDGQACAVRFNLSHTRGLVGCAVTATADIGFDVEETRQPAPLDVVSRYFSDQEIAGLRGVPSEQRHDRFYVLWTLKEAYIKGRGLGLEIPLDSFTCAPTSPGRARLVVDGRDDRATPWSLHWWTFDRHAAALAVRAPDDQVRVDIAVNLRIATLEPGVGARR